ncbi:MAG: 2OG-Fe(II) oxygenase [Pseudomonadota bacterium]
MDEGKGNESLEARAAGGDAEAQEEFALGLLAASEPGQAAFDSGLAWLERAIEGGRLSALAAKGHVHLQHPTLADAPAVARDCFVTGARAGDPHAVERLEDLHLFGYGVERYDEKAWSLYSQLAGYGFPAVLCHAAYLKSEGVGCDADEGEAASMILRAAAQGHTLAFYLAAHRYAGGVGVPEDPTVAVAWMELAAARGFPSAEALWQQWLDDLDDASRHNARELAERLKQNLRELGRAVRALPVDEGHPEYPQRFNELVIANYRSLGLRELDPDAAKRGMDIRRRPARRFDLLARSWMPRVFEIPDFATPEERGFLLDLALPLLKPTADTTGAGRAIEVDAFDGDCAIFPPYLTTPVIRNLLRRFALLTQVRETHFEPMSLLRYSVGHEYSPHVDWFDGGRMERHWQSGDRGGQRITTALIYLIVPQEGGDTWYPASETRITGEPGMAVIHHNATPDGTGDPRSLHHGTPIRAGEKWLARTAVREASLYDDFWRSL